MYSTQSITIAELMGDINSYYLPAIQREFVWASAKIENLFDSLLRGYPVGTMLRWDVKAPTLYDFQFYTLINNFDQRSSHNVKANLLNREQCYGILDGQQRITSLYIGLLGSYIEKLPRLWKNNPEAYPKKQLYINLLYKPEAEDAEQKYQIKFLTQAQAVPSTRAYWFKVGDILKYKDRDSLRAFRRSTVHKDNEDFEDTLDTLWKSVFDDRNLTFFNETRQNLDEVLNIFVRLNSGGTPLGYSDLLLSLATATWKTHDAREQVYALVDHLNKECGSFYFSKDFVLKAILLISDADVRFRATNVRKRPELENAWEKVSAALRITVRLLQDFGIDGQTLTAPYAALPIAYYLNKRGLANDGFLTQSAYREERETIRVWLFKILLARAFGSQTDALLTGLRDVINTSLSDAGTKTFPIEAMFAYLKERRGFTFTDEQIIALVRDTQYGDPYSFTLLALLTPSLSFKQSQFHVDHLHPASQFKGKFLQSAGMRADDIKFALEHYNDLPNLHLLLGSDNKSKNDSPLKTWMASRQDALLLKQVSLIPDDLDLALQNFREFHDVRQKLLTDALRTRLTPQHSLLSSSTLSTPTTPENLVTGQSEAE